MKASSRRLGSCLCGAVRLSVDSSKTDLGACHCAKCLTWAGGPLFELECGADVVFEGVDYIQTFASSAWAERGFCKQCGGHLFIKDIRNNEYGIPPGLFADDAGLSLNRQIFIDHKPGYYSLAEQTNDITSNFIYEHYPETREDRS